MHSYHLHHYRTLITAPNARPHGHNKPQNVPSQTPHTPYTPHADPTDFTTPTETLY